jgi:two-component system, chemotaxis family, CheB/CheR fusion protein
MSNAEKRRQSKNGDSGPGDLVVVGSSAGGIEALSILVSKLPTDFPAPIVLAQHLDPTRPSSLDTILRRRTTLPVELVNMVSPLEKGKIYVVPSNRLVTIDDGQVRVQEDQLARQRPRPSVDVLLTSAAQAYGEHLIAVILTGSGSDGAAGAIEVQNAGGTVIAQDPKTARYPSMPLALPPTVIDFEADIENIGPLLYDLLTGIDLPRTEGKTEDTVRDILELISRQASIDFRPYKTSTIVRRIVRRMTVTHNRTMQSYVDYLKAHPEEVGELVKAFLINVTQFFRDPEAFEYLKRDILPQLIAQARAKDRVLRIWTAGASSGEEPYSLAMLMADLLGAELPDWSVKIFATDLDDGAINFARRGLYSENMLKGLSPGYREMFFERTDHGYRISKLLRQMVIFGHHDLSRSAPFPRIDLILCRNVLIYFSPELQEYVLNRFAFSLNPGGYLFLGKAETVRPGQPYFELVNKHWKVYRSSTSALPTANRPNFGDLNVAPSQKLANSSSSKAPQKANTDQEPLSPPFEIGQLRRLNELLLRYLPVGIVVIDRSYHVLTANGTARRLLGLRDIAIEQDFLHAVRGIPYTTVRSGIDSVFRERNAVTLPELELDMSSGGNGRFISVSITLMQLEAGAPDLVSLSVTDVTEQVQIRRQLESAQVEQAQLMHELSSANRRLNDVNKELMDTNEELQIANEELVLTHEELQATIEEFETTNEELQATNEELETNNEELQATNEELETTNEELRARSAEMQELTTLLQNERVRLLEMVELAPFDLIVLRGANLTIEAFNQRYARLLEGREILGRPLAEVSELLWNGGGQLLQLARKAFKQDSTSTTPRMRAHLPQAEGEARESYFVYTIVPTHDTLGRVTGVIIYAIDQTQERIREAEEERERLKLIFENADVAALALYDAQTTELLIASPRYLDIAAQLHKLDRDKLIGRKWPELSFITPPEEATRLWNEAVEHHTSLYLSEVHVKQGEQETVWYDRLIPVFNIEKQDNQHLVLALAVEITEQVQARQEVERLNKLKDEFLSLASHELRTPLTSMLGNAQIALRDLKRRETTADTQKGIQQVEQNLDRIIHQIRRMDRLIDEMLDITRMRGEVFELQIREDVNLVELTRQLAEQLTAATNRSITIDTNEEAIQVPCDVDRIEQVLTNLLNNAIKYSPQDKPVVVGMKQQSDSGEVYVWVRDQGQGISEEEQEFIFHRFYRSSSSNAPRTEGLGLGLYIAHEIVIRHGGRMWLESKLGEGSTFYFTLPLEKRS